MKLKSMGKKFMIVFSAVLIFVFNSSVGATEQTARLKYSIENDHMYKCLTVDHMGYWIAASESSFKSTYNGMYVTVSGEIRASSVSGNRKTMVLYGNEKSIEVDTSDTSVINTVNSIALGDKVRVYGKVNSLKIKAEHLVVNPEFDFNMNSYVFYPDEKFDEETITDLTKDGHVSFRLPAAWKNDYVFGRLTNNDVNGYSFFLNAISPQNLKYPENFYVFYFKYETYLDKPPKSPTKGDRRDIEKMIINNILGNLSGTTAPKMTEVTLFNGKTLDYCQTIYRPKDGNDYRLEFMFKPDKTGIICMLYLYYPNDAEGNHIHEVAYVVHTLESTAQ